MNSSSPYTRSVHAGGIYGESVQKRSPQVTNAGESPIRERRCRPTYHHATPAEPGPRMISGQAVTAQNRRCNGMACVVVAIVVAAERLTTVERRQSGW